MNEQVLVRPGISPWYILVRLIGPIVLIIGLVCYLNKLPPAVPLAVAGGIMILVFELIAVLVNRRRRWVQDSGNGFVVTDSEGIRQFNDDQIESIALYSDKIYSGGEMKALRRFFLVWVAGDANPIIMENKIPVGGQDPLDAMINRILDSHVARAEAAINRGLSVAGDGWSLDTANLTLGHSSMGQAVSLSEITAIDIFGNQLCIWRRGQDEAFARFPLSSRNAHVLDTLLSKRLAERGQQPASDTTGLGRILFERKPQAGMIAALWFFALLVGMGGVVMFAVVPDVGIIAGPIMIGVGALLVLAAIATQKANFRCHERGVFQSGMMSEKQLLYADVGSFSYGATRHYYNGVYTGTQLIMQFQPADGSGGRPISYNTTVRTDDADLDALRDHISQVIAARMADDLSKWGQVAWTPNLTFRTEGIEFRPAGWFGRKEPELLPWEQLAGFDIEQGVFHLWRAGQDKSIVQEQVSVANFFPGFFLLLSRNANEDDEQL